MVNRRTFLLQSAALAASGCACPFGSCSAGSIYKGIPIGVITYSYRTMPVGVYKTLEYVKASGLTEMEFMSNDLELDAGAPVNKLPWKMTKEEKAQVDAWRKTVDLKNFEAVREKYDAAGVKAHIVKFGGIGGAKAESAEDARAQTDEGQRRLSQSLDHGIRHIPIRFKVALTDIGADGGPDIFGIAAESGDHSFHGLFRNACGSTLPACVDCAHNKRAVCPFSA